ncbi:blue copper protein 1a-like [Hibiscus syriacus]|uniref:blue copper protein 1a-like n=1 Tax=Hibiscus syriacus TaxID=106335 RepID=UPI001921C6B7|nr:blue copper protein 1a-like [Hibiscus syriacus]
MGVHRSLLVFAIAALMAPSISMATEFVVGDDQGWGLGIDYDAWAQGKQFFVGDNLGLLFYPKLFIIIFFRIIHVHVFKYKAGYHNVYKVTGDEFQDCTVPSSNSSGSFSGNDKIKLATAGNKWYICGVNGHCQSGQKLTITVLQGAAPAPAPAPAPVAPGPASSFQAADFEILLG